MCEETGGGDHRGHRGPRGLAWFVYSPLSDIVCGNANGSLDGRSEIYLWTCKRSCDRGDARACLYEHDLEMPAPPRYDALGDRVPRAQRECESGHACACADLGSLYGEQMVDPGGRALAHLRRACDGGCARACTSLGMRLGNGDDAVRAYEHACKAGDAWGCERLAEALGTEPARASAAFVRSCELGLYKACWNGSNVNPRRMEMLGCRLDPNSCVRPAYDHFFGSSGETASPELVATLSSWCGRTERRASLACTCLGEMLTRGKGMPADPRAGDALLDLECAGGGEYACLSRALHNPDRVAARAEIDRACTSIGQYDGRCEDARFHFARNEDFVVCHPDPVE